MGQLIPLLRQDQLHCDHLHGLMIGIKQSHLSSKFHLTSQKAIPVPN